MSPARTLKRHPTVYVLFQADGRKMRTSYAPRPDNPPATSNWLTKTYKSALEVKITLEDNEIKKNMLIMTVGILALHSCETQ
jgi:hypothetical protein